MNENILFQSLNSRINTSRISLSCLEIKLSEIKENSGKLHFYKLAHKSLSLDKVNSSINLMEIFKKKNYPKRMTTLSSSLWQKKNDFDWTQIGKEKSWLPG